MRGREVCWIERFVAGDDSVARDQLEGVEPAQAEMDGVGDPCDHI